MLVQASMKSTWESLKENLTKPIWRLPGNHSKRTWPSQYEGYLGITLRTWPSQYEGYLGITQRELDQANMKATWESLKENRKTTIPDKDICVIKSINLEKLLYHHLWTMYSDPNYRCCVHVWHGVLYESIYSISVYVKSTDSFYFTI